MSHDDPERHILIREQKRMFRLAASRHGLTPKVLVLETGLNADTLKSWRTDTPISLTGLRKLVRVIPDELTSLLLAGTDKHIGTDEGDDGDLDALASGAAELVTEHVRARSAKSPGGTNIIPMEAERIKEIGRKVCANARACQ